MSKCDSDIDEMSFDFEDEFIESQMDELPEDRRIHKHNQGFRNFKCI